jgi:hypothetical protein
MADSYIGIARAAFGNKNTDFVIGASSTSTTDFELRIAALDQAGNPMTRKDLINALEAFQLAVEGNGTISTTIFGNP